MGLITQIELRKKIYVTTLRQTASPTKARNAAKVGSKSTIDGWLRKDRKFARECAQAEEEAVDDLEAEARRRGYEGVVEPIVTAKGLVYDRDGNLATRRVYSDSLLTLQLKALRRQKYGDKSAVELSGPGGGPIQTESIRERIARRLQALAVVDAEFEPVASLPTGGPIAGAADGSSERDDDL